MLILKGGDKEVLPCATSDSSFGDGSLEKPRKAGAVYPSKMDLRPFVGGLISFFFVLPLSFWLRMELLFLAMWEGMVTVRWSG